MEKLDRWFTTASGQAIRAVLDVDFALQVRLGVRWDRLNYYEFLLLRILNEERNKLQEEEMKKARRG